MAYKVTKKGTKFAVVKGFDGWSDEWYIVDIESGTTLDWYASASSAKTYLEWLEDGIIQPEEVGKYWGGHGQEIDMPASLKQMQKKLQNPTPKKTAPSLDSSAAKIAEVKDEGLYKLLKMEDGSYGVLVPGTGQSKLGLKSPAGAKMSAKSMLKKAAQGQLDVMGVDAGSDAVDTLLGAYEGRMRDMYGQAAAEMAEKQSAKLEKYYKELALRKAKVSSGLMGKDEMEAWKKAKATEIAWHSDMVDSLTKDMVNADKSAMRMLNGYVPRAYAENINFGTFQLEQATGINTGFALYNESTVARLVSNPEGSLLPGLPQPLIDAGKDEAWCREKINACVTQSILQGESIKDAAARLMRVVGMSANSAMRSARTALTGAQNMGRMDAMKRAKAMGIKLKKQWIATVDGRTRYSHRGIDRESVELEEQFSNGCDHPGDPGGPAQEVYNCRCAMRSVLPGHEYDDLPDRTKEGQAYDEWKAEHETHLEHQKEKLQSELDRLKGEEANVKAMLPDNKAYSGIWKDEVHLSDYAAKEGSIAAKEDYYLGQIVNGTSMDVADAKKKLLQLHEFQTEGKKYEAAKSAVQSQLDAITARKKEVTSKLLKLGVDDTYSDERKAAARYCKSMAESLRHYDAKGKEVWATATKAQRDGLYTYTESSGGHNRPLSGFRKPWAESGNGWEEKFFVGVGKVPIDYEGKGDAIRGMTELISKSSYDEDIWLRRGCDFNAVESLLDVPFGSLSGMTSEQLQSYVGTSNRVGGFLSCGSAGGTGFTHKPVEMEVYAPAGTNMFYVPGRGYAPYRGENEMVIQRGASLTVTDIEKSGGRVKMKVEVHPEDGYDLFQQDPSEWTGPKEFYR